MGDAVAQMAYGAFSEWGVVPARHALPVPEPAPEVVALLTSGLTASIGVGLCLGFRFRPVPDSAPEVVALLTSGLTASIGTRTYVHEPSYGPEGSSYCGEPLSARSLASMMPAVFIGFELPRITDTTDMCGKCHAPRKARVGCRSICRAGCKLFDGLRRKQ